MFLQNIIPVVRIKLLVKNEYLNDRYILVSLTTLLFYQKYMFRHSEAAEFLILTI